jgi:hypothetical protein
MTLGIVIVLLLLSTVTNCGQIHQQVQLRTLSAREYYPQALEKAQQWKPDAYLADISVDVLSEEDSTRRLLLFFGFESPSDDRHSLLITFQEGVDEPKVKNIYREIPISVHNPINSEDWPVDSLKALAIAQGNGGDEFLAKHDPKTALMTLYLERLPKVPGARLQWRASFWDLATSEKVRIMLDPRTGEVIEVDRQPSR